MGETKQSRRGVPLLILLVIATICAAAQLWVSLTSYGVRWSSNEPVALRQHIDMWNKHMATEEGTRIVATEDAVLFLSQNTFTSARIRSRNDHVLPSALAAAIMLMLVAAAAVQFGDCIRPSAASGTSTD